MNDFMQYLLEEPIRLSILFMIGIACVIIISSITVSFLFKRDEKKQAKIFAIQGNHCVKCFRPMQVGDNQIKIIDKAVNKIYCTECYNNIIGRLSDYQ